MLKRLGLLVLLVQLVVFSAANSGEAAQFKVELRETDWELKPGLVTKVWSYNGSVPGQPIVVSQGEFVKVEVTNQLPVSTNIHWHGLVVPNDQDGPAVLIDPGQRYVYGFKAEDTGTYWYHSHYRPVLEQVDRGLYAPFIIKSPEDAAYSGDHVYVLDDWYLNAGGNRLAGTAKGNMERYGNIETVNGKTGPAIEPLVMMAGELHKLRFINASTAAVHTLTISGHTLRVTHTDGHPLPEPYYTKTITLNPGERIDAELAASGEPGGQYVIESDRSSLGIQIPILYKEGKVAAVPSPFIPPKSTAVSVLSSKQPDYILELGSEMMTSSSQGTVGHGGHGGHGAPLTAAGTTRWTINGKSFPDTDSIQLKAGQTVRVRFINKDDQPNHRMDHPIHIHGTKFQVVSLNGNRPEREIWKDTINVPAGEYVDVEFAIANPGEWMLHCHIIDHEDGGMLTKVVVE